MKKLYKYALWLAAAVAIAPMTSCNDDDEVDPYTLNYVYLYQPSDTHANVEYKANGDFMSGLSDPLELVPIRLTKPAPQDIEVEVAIDPTLVDEYNEQKGTNYTFLSGAEIVTPKFVILKGSYVSDKTISVSFTDHSGFLNGTENMILPIVIKSAPGATISKSSRVFLTFNSTYRANYVSASSNVRYANALIELPNWQNEFKEIELGDLFTLTYSPYENVTVTAQIDGSKVAAYNEANGTEYTFKNDATLASATATITPEQNGASFKLKTGDLSGMAGGTSYIVPIVLKSVSGAAVELGTETTVYVIMRAVAKELTISQYDHNGTALSYPSGTTALLNGTTDWWDVVNPSSWGYDNMEADDELTISLPTAVNLVSIYINHWAAYNAAKTVTLQTSLDGTTWDDWGSATTETAYGKYYVNLSYSTGVKHVKLKFSNFNRTYCEIDGIQLYVE